MSGEIYFGEVDVRRFDRFEIIMSDQLDALNKIVSVLDVLRCGLIDVESEVEKLRAALEQGPATSTNKQSLPCCDSFHNVSHTDNSVCPACGVPF